MSDAIRVLVVEDEQSFVDALTVGLRREGFEVEVATDGVAALEAFDRSPPDIVLLDLMLPRLSGLDVCREIRTRSQVPVIMVTAKGTEVDTVVGLEIGADDYMTKPYRLRELVARMRAVLRRAESPTGTRVADETSDETSNVAVVVGDVTVDPGRHEVQVRGEVMAMPLREFELLSLLMDNAGRVLTRDVLIDRVWGYDYVGDTRTLDVHVKRIRSKIEIDPRHPERLVTIRGVGYRYELPDT
ncbi:MAG TPA: response regulator transcription factor [Acidimicrobiales bacterium]|nr:response regulator transcription factor [Actinomycetes bacterium]MDP6177115.1 response regulator transcription factor [Acidimicrobiales bacterium]MCP4846077.1 response regulator transcription factor [Actinomycetes bacterium]MDP6239795.1 response regulator transcription factor [Acidimicrobiales bacterium]MDP7124914.1 response regulator transcription factor [Acidimicrobiales bacterium]